MKIYDISMPIYHEMPVYKGHPSKRPIFTNDSDFTSGSVYETRLNMNLHTGTHLDLSLHISPNGTTIDHLDLARVITPCKVLDLTCVSDKISQSHLAEKSIVENDFILLKTKNSYLELLEGEFIYLDTTGAEYLKTKNISGVGIDALGIERNQPDHGTHKLLLSSGIIVLEGLRLNEVDEGSFFLIATPLRIVGVEAAPARAILIRED